MICFESFVILQKTSHLSTDNDSSQKQHNIIFLRLPCFSVLHFCPLRFSNVFFVCFILHIKVSFFSFFPQNCNYRTRKYVSVTLVKEEKESQSLPQLGSQFFFLSLAPKLWETHFQKPLLLSWSESKKAMRGKIKLIFSLHSG